MLRRLRSPEPGKETASELRWRRDLNPRTVLAVSRFQGECIRPLCHATAGKRSARRIQARATLPFGLLPFGLLPSGLLVFSASLIRRQFSPMAVIC